MSRNKIGWILGVGIIGLGLIPHQYLRPPITPLAQGRSVLILGTGAGTSLQTCTIIKTSLTCVHSIFSRCSCVRDAKMLVQVWRLVPAKTELIGPTPLVGSISPKGTLIDSFPLPTTFGFGRPASPSDIAKLDIDIRPDGLGLPPGAGTAAEGKPIYDLKCAACHGVAGVGGPNGSLAINPSTPAGRREKVIGNYWPYATTIFDYVRRAMPFNRPGSLTNEEVYKLTAYLLYLNQLVDEKTSIDAQSLPKIVMPAQQWYVTDDREGGPQIK